MDLWLEYLQITQHPFLDRFENGNAVELMYERAVVGIPPLYNSAPESWCYRATNTAAALARLGEMVSARADFMDSPDWLKVLEDCEEPESIDLIEKIFHHFKAGPFSQPVPDIAATEPALASEKQRAYLRRLGVKNFSGTRREASALIDTLLAKKNEESIQSGIPD